jgi:two-component system, NtrC family, response regulator AtoC
MEVLAATVQEPAVQPWHLPERIEGRPAASADQPGAAASAAPPAAEAPHPFRPVEEELRELERARMIQALEASDGVQTRAAELIGMPRRTFLTRCKQYGLLPRRHPSASPPDEPEPE